MKIIYLRDQSKFRIEDEVAEKIIKNLNNTKFILLPNGDLINTVEITKITSETEKKLLETPEDRKKRDAEEFKNEFQIRMKNIQKLIGNKK